jgi:hypothetical protein
MRANGRMTLSPIVIRKMLPPSAPSTVCSSTILRPSGETRKLLYASMGSGSGSTWPARSTRISDRRTPFTAGLAR